MKKITKNTVLRCGDKTYQPVKEMDGSIFWEDEDFQIVAQSELVFENVPVINLDSYIEKLALNQNPIDIREDDNCSSDSWDINKQYRKEWVDGYYSNSNQFTEKDIEKTIDLAAPEQWQVIEFFRLKYDIWTTVNQYCSTGYYYIITGNTKDGQPIRGHIYDLPQESYSAAFNYILNNLI